MYGKLFESTYTGSMVGSGADVFAVWTYIIAHTKQDSTVELNPRLVAMILGMTPDNVQRAIDFLEAPDPVSRSKDFEGRRLIREGEYQFLVPQAEKYRSIRNDDERKAYNRDRKRLERQRQKSNAVAPLVIDSHGHVAVLSISTEADTEADTEEKPSKTKTDADADKNTRAHEEPENLPGLDVKAWHRWIAYRKERKKPIRGMSVIPAALELIKHGADQAAVVERSIANGWQGLFPLNGSGAAVQPRQRAKTLDELERAEITRLLAAGGSDRAIADAVGVHMDRVAAIRAEVTEHAHE